MYADRSDIEAAYGETALLGAAGDDGLIEDARIVRALDKASEEIDSYIGNRHALPLPAVPPRLRDVCVDMAVYHLSGSADVLSDDIRERYKSSVQWLKSVSKGEASLGLPKQNDRSPRPVVTSGAPRQFSRRAMRDL